MRALADLNELLQGDNRVTRAVFPPRRTMAEVIEELADRYDNHNTSLAEDAVRADREGRAAFWKRTRYHNAIVGLVVANVNAGGELAIELANWCSDMVNRRPLDVLRELIPLNMAAAWALGDARARAERAEDDRLAREARIIAAKTDAAVEAGARLMAEHPERISRVVYNAHVARWPYRGHSVARVLTDCRKRIEKHDTLPLRTAERALMKMAEGE